MSTPAAHTGVRYLSFAEAVRQLNCSTGTIRRWVEQGRLHAYRVGERLRRIDADELERIRSWGQHERARRRLSSFSVPVPGCGPSSCYYSAAPVNSRKEMMIHARLARLEKSIVGPGDGGHCRCGLPQLVPGGRRRRALHSRALSALWRAVPQVVILEAGESAPSFVDPVTGLRNGDLTR